MKFMTMGFILSKFCPQLSTGKQFCRYLEVCKITHTEKHHSGKTNPRYWIQLSSNFPQRKWVFGSGTRAGSSACCSEALGQARSTHPNLTVTRERILECTDFVPQHKWMTFKQLEAGWIYILLQKKKGKVHTWGGNGVNNNYLKPGFYHFYPQLPTAFEAAGLLPAVARSLTIWTGLWSKETFSKLRPTWK